jgi:hypothetical protein
LTCKYKDSFIFVVVAAVVVTAVSALIGVVVEHIF